MVAHKTDFNDVTLVSEDTHCNTCNNKTLEVCKGSGLINVLFNRPTNSKANHSIFIKKKNT